MENIKGSAKKSKKNKKRKSLSESITSVEGGNISRLEGKIEPPLLEKTSPHEFKILIDSQHPRLKKLKTRHAVLLHPSVLRAYGSPWYFYIRGKNKSNLCVGFNQKTVKKNTIVLFNNSMGFSHEELVELYPYPGRATKASEVTVSFDAETSVSENVEDQVLQILGNQRFLSSEMKFSLPYHEGCEFSISSMLPAEKEHSFDFSLNNATNDLTCGQSKSSFAEITSELSQLTLNDESINSNFEFDLNTLPDVNIPTFFTIYSGTYLIIRTPKDKLSEQSNFKPTKVTSFVDIVGLNKELHSIKIFINNHLIGSNFSGAAAVVSIIGPQSSGKSMILESIHNEFDANIESVIWYNIYAKTQYDGLKELKETFGMAIRKAPSIVLIDDFQYLIPSDGSEKNTSNVLSQEIKNCVEKRVVIIVASSDPNSEKEILDLKNLDLLDIKLNLPDVCQREKIIIKLLENEKHSLSAEDIKKLALKSHGFTGKDLKRTVKDAVKHHSINNRVEENLPFSKVEASLQNRKPSILKSDVKIKKVKWEDIGGMVELKEKLKNVVEGPLKYPEAYKRFNVKPARGVLLYGPPGCSKTMIAKALATECDFHFISKNVSDIHNKYVGESEKAVHDLFVSARANVPCIVFLDEIDALIPSRGSSTGSGVEERVVNTFLQEIDGVEELNNVIIVAATNRPDRIDEAFLRYGRINHHIYVPLPDFEARKEILSLHKRKRSVDSNVDFNELALRTDGYSGAEIVNLWNEAAFQVLEENLDCKTFKMHHFERALQIILPKTDEKLLEIYETFNSKFGSND